MSGGLPAVVMAMRWTGSGLIRLILIEGLAFSKSSCSFCGNSLRLYMKVTVAWPCWAGAACAAGAGVAVGAGAATVGAGAVVGAAAAVGAEAAAFVGAADAWPCGAEVGDAAGDEQAASAELAAASPSTPISLRRLRTDRVMDVSSISDLAHWIRIPPSMALS